MKAPSGISSILMLTTSTFMQALHGTVVKIQETTNNAKNAGVKLNLHPRIFMPQKNKFSS